MQALEVYTGIIDKVMSQSSPRECDIVGEQMRRIEEMLADE